MNDLNKRGFLSVLKEQIRSNHRVFVVWASLRLIVIAALVLSAIRQDYESVFICVLTLLLFLIPSLIQRNLDIQFPTTLQIVILLHIFAAQILGELSSYYIHFKHWDTILHTLNGFLCAAVGFSLVDILNRSERFHMQLSPLFVAIVAFCFSMTIGVLWEFFEFGMDMLMGVDMQKDTVVTCINSTFLDSTNTNTVVRIKDIGSTVVNGQALEVVGYLDIGLIDTIEDLIVNFIGAAVFSVTGYFYIKNRKDKSIISGFVPFMKENKTEEKEKN